MCACTHTRTQFFLNCPVYNLSVVFSDPDLQFQYAHPIKIHLHVNNADSTKGTLPSVEKCCPCHEETLCSLALKSSSGALFSNKTIPLPPTPPVSWHHLIVPVLFTPQAAANLDSNGLEKLRVSEGQLHHFLDLSQLFAAASNVVIANLIQSLLLFLRNIRRTHTSPTSDERTWTVMQGYASEMNHQSEVYSATAAPWNINCIRLCTKNKCMIHTPVSQWWLSLWWLKSKDIKIIRHTANQAMIQYKWWPYSVVMASLQGTILSCRHTDTGKRLTRTPAPNVSKRTFYASRMLVHIHVHIVNSN